MKNILIINGSPRKNGNTAAALKALESGLKGKYPDAKISTIDTYSLQIKPCVNCDRCRANQGKCVFNDGANEALAQVIAADTVIFGTPVYWWGMSASLKLLVDKFYAPEEALRASKKTIGAVIVGAAGLEDPEYKLIADQFQCICGFLGWNFALNLPLSAYAAGELAGNAAKLQEIAAKGAEL